jgi:hypothetical protein
MGPSIPRVVLTILLAGAGRVEAQCFQPLADPNSTDPANWRDLINFVPPASLVRPKEIERILVIADARGDRINLDYYSVTFQKHPSKSLQEYFRDLRQAFDTFAQAGSGVDRFGPYQIKTAETDPVRKRNADLWQSASPTGALMTFVLESIGIGRFRNRPYFVLKHGDVFVGCSSPTDFIFSTVKSNAEPQGETYHPVSGNRGFGLKDNGDSTWTFYSKGADRETAGEIGGFVFSNVLALGRFPDEAAFGFGELFWQKFYPELITFLKRQGVTVRTVGDKAFIMNSRRYSYPLPGGPQLNASALDVNETLDGSFGVIFSEVGSGQNEAGTTTNGVTEKAGDPILRHPIVERQ